MKSFSVKNIIFSIILISIIIGCFSLGLWQVDRYSQKQQLNNTPSDGVAVNITELLSTQLGEDHVGKTVDVAGHFIADSVIKLDNKMSDSVYGVDIFSLFREMTTDRVYLVNMGWFEVGNKRDRLSRQFIFDGEHRFKARLANFPSKPPFIDADHFRDEKIQDLWLFINKEFLMQHYGVTVEELILVNQQPSNPLKYRETKKPDNAFMHILYAIQWFLFSFFALFGLIKIYK